MNRVIRLEYAYGVCPRCGRRDKLCYLIRQDGMMHKPHEVKCINCNSYFTREEVGLHPKPKTNTDRIPAADVKPVVHGKWVEQSKDFDLCGVKYFACNQCGFECQLTYNYCPNCGAKMEGVKNE